MPLGSYAETDVAYQIHSKVHQMTFVEHLP
jgi:hypothetical protein